MWKKDRLKSKNGYAWTYKQSGNAVESVRKNKEKATVGRICGKGSFQAWNEKMRGEQFI